MIEIMLLPPPFARLPASARSQVRLMKDAPLFHQGDPARAMFFVVTGCIGLIRHTEDGHRVVIHRADGQTFFAEASLFSDTYHCDAIALENTSVLVMKKHDILRFISTDPEFALGVTQRLAADVQAHRKRLEILSIKNAEARIFAALASFEQGASVTAFAAFIGLSYEATQRGLSSLVRQGRVSRIARGKYHVGRMRD